MLILGASCDRRKTWHFSGGRGGLTNWQIEILLFCLNTPNIWRKLKYVVTTHPIFSKLNIDKVKTLFWKGACLGWCCWAMGSSGQSTSKQVNKYFLNRWKSISWIRFHHFSFKTIWSLISNAKTRACVPLDSKIKLILMNSLPLST